MNNINKIAICQEIFGDMDIKQLIKLIKEIGYDGLELAPFKFAEDIRTLSASYLREIKDFAQMEEITLIACHWLLVSPKGLHITHPDQNIRDKTMEFFKALIEFSKELGVEILVFGSPNQRSIQEGWDKEESIEKGIEFFQKMGDYAKDKGIIIAFEPLGPQITNFGGTIKEAKELISKINRNNVKIHLDINAMVRDPQEIDDILDETDMKTVAHFHLNDPNNLGPGMGELNFKPILKKVVEKEYQRWFSVETFDTTTEPAHIAKESLRNYKKIMESLREE